MDMLDAYVGYDLGSCSEPDDIPRTDETVWILGKQYHATDGEFSGCWDHFTSISLHLSHVFPQILRQYGRMCNHGFGVPIGGASLRSVTHS